MGKAFWRSEFDQREVRENALVVGDVSGDFRTHDLALFFLIKKAGGGGERSKEMRRVYRCFDCGEWFKEAKMADHGALGKVEVCPFCGRSVYQTRGIKAVLVKLWWWLRELFSSGGSSPVPK